MAKIRHLKSATSGKKKDQKAVNLMIAQSLARRFPLFEPGRNLVGFLKGMVSSGLTDHITDLLRGYSREMQKEITNSIRIHILWGEVDLVGLRHVDDELEKIFDWYDEDILY